MNFEEFYILMPVRVAVNKDQQVRAIETPAIDTADQFLSLSAKYDTVKDAKEDFDNILVAAFSKVD